MKRILLLMAVFFNVFIFRAVSQTNNDSSFFPIEVSPADGETVNKLDVITMKFPCEVNVNGSLKVEVYSAEEGASADAVALARLAISVDGDYTKATLTLRESIASLGSYKIVIPAGAIWAADDEATKTPELAYVYKVDPEYWNPEWVIEVGANCTKESPSLMEVGYKYKYTSMYSYIQFTATETGCVYLALLEGKDESMTLRDENWQYVGSMAETEDGGYWFGVEAGKTYKFCSYGFQSRVFAVTFESGTPYKTIEFIESNPIDGGIYSKSTSGKFSKDSGFVDFVFTHEINAESLKVFIAIPSKENKEIDVTDNVLVEIGKVWGVGSYVGLDVCGAIEEIKTQEGLKAGDKIQIVLKDVQDVEFAENKLAEELRIELTLAATVCTSVYPGCEDEGLDSIPSEISLWFDGNVTCVSGEGYIVDVNSGLRQKFLLDNLTCERVETDGLVRYGMTVSLPEVSLELTSKRFDVRLNGLIDDEGNAVSYGSEAGNFVINYNLRDDNLFYISANPETESEVASIKTTRLTFAEEVHLSPDEDVESPFFYVGDEIVEGIMSIDLDDPKSVIITWAQEITKPGRYKVTIAKSSIYNSKFDASKADYGVSDGASYNRDYELIYYIPANLSSTTVSSITPQPGVGWGGGVVSQLPSEVVIEFKGQVKEVLSAYAETGSGTWTTGADVVTSSDIPDGATVLTSRVEENKVIITIPPADVSAVSAAKYVITVKALGEDGKLISYAFGDRGTQDMYAEYISFFYIVEKGLELLSVVPADGSTVKQLDKIVLTFDDVISEIGSDVSIELWDEQDNAIKASISFEGNVATLAFEPAVTTSACYGLTIPAGLFATAEYVTNTELYMNYTVDPDKVESLSIVSVTPENGATVENLTKVEFKLNKEVGYLHTSMLIPSDDGDDAGYAALVRSETDPTVYTLDFTLLSENGIALRKGISYTLTLESFDSEEAYNQNQGVSETVTLTYVGDADAYQYSDVTFEGVTPTEDFVITDKSQNQFTVKFSDAVNLVDGLTYLNLGQGRTQKFQTVIANETKTEYTLTIPENILESLRNEVILVIAANDESGMRVKGNNGKEEYSTIVLTFTTIIGVPDLVIAPDASIEQASLKEFSIKCTEGLNPSWTAGRITLKDVDGNEIALNGDPEPVLLEGSSEWATPTEWKISLKEELTTIGTYTLLVPVGYFNIGNTQGVVQNSKETVAVFKITQAAKDTQCIRSVRFDTGIEVIVYDVTGRLAAKGKTSEVLKNLSRGIYIVNGKKTIVK